MYKMTMFCVGVALVLSGCGEDEETLTPPPTLAAADVTFLVQPGDAAGFSAQGEGGYGTLLPRAIFDQLEPLTRTDEPDALYAHLDVVGVRLDPCFREGQGEAPCQSQVRLVLQPVFEEDGAPISRDATVHLFYEVPIEELRALATSLAALREARGGGETIGAHVAPDEAAVRVLPRVGAERLRRVTFVAVHASGQAWTFGGFEVRGEGLEEIEPFSVGTHEQHLTSTGGTALLDATILPTPTVEPEAARWLSAAERGEMDAATQAEARAGLRRLLDPTAHNPGTVDCASCHMATPALYFAEPGTSGVPAAYADSQNQRMLGFFGRVASISPRVEAETDAVLEALKAP